MAQDGKPFPLFDQDPDTLWARVCDILRERGEDPDEVVRQAAENMQRWREQRAAMSEDERRADDEAQARAWAAHEATLDDAGNPLKT